MPKKAAERPENTKHAPVQTGKIGEPETYWFSETAKRKYEAKHGKK